VTAARADVAPYDARAPERQASVKLVCETFSLSRAAYYADARRQRGELVGKVQNVIACPSDRATRQPTLCALARAMLQPLLHRGRTKPC
jgi:hypothetical protein